MLMNIFVGSRAVPSSTCVAPVGITCVIVPLSPNHNREPCIKDQDPSESSPFICTFTDSPERAACVVIPKTSAVTPEAGSARRTPTGVK